jgi:hypothetical protein
MCLSLVIGPKVEIPSSVYTAIYCSCSACSFGKVVGQDKALGDYNPAGGALDGVCWYASLNCASGVWCKDGVSAAMHQDYCRKFGSDG